MIYLVSFCIVVLISLVDFYSVKKNRSIDMKKSIIWMFGMPFASFIIFSIIYKLTCTFTVSHNMYLPWLSLIICTLAELFAASKLLKNKYTAIIRRLFILSVVLSVLEIFLFNFLKLNYLLFNRVFHDHLNNID